MIALRVLREGVPLREALIERLPITIGRGEGCEFPLADASVSRQHARLERDETGTLVLRDLGSRNGLHVGPRRVESTAIASSVRVRIGGVEVEVEEVSDAVTQEVRLPEWHDRERRRGLRHHLFSTLLGVTGWVVGVASDAAFWSPWEKSRGVALISHLIGALVALPLLSALLLVVLKAFGRRLRLGDTLATLARVVWLIPLTSLLAYLAYYLFSSGSFAALHGLLTVGLTAWAIAEIAAVRRPPPSRAFRLLWMLAVLGLAAGTSVTASLTAERSGQPQLDFYVQRPIAGWAGRSLSLDGYFAKLKTTAAEASAEAVAQRND
jgi:hypothetical protein